MARPMTRIPTPIRAAALLSLALAAVSACSGGAPPQDTRPASEAPHDSLATILAHADEAYREADLTEAQNTYEEALRVDPDNPHAVSALATCYLKGRLTRKAEEILSAHLQKAPGDTTARLVLARVFIRESDLARAADALRAVLRSDPDNLVAHYNLGYVDYKRRDYNDARIHLTRTIELRPDHPEAHYTLGLTEMARGRYDAAIAELERAVAINPRHVGAHFNLTNAYARAGRMQAARKEQAIYAELSGHSKAQTERATQIATQSVKAIQLVLDRKYPEALAEYESLAARYPDDAPLHNQIGILRLRLGRRDEALAAFKKAATLDPRLSDPHYALASLYREMGDEKAAERELSIFSTLEAIPEGKSGY